MRMQKARVLKVVVVMGVGSKVTFVVKTLTFVELILEMF
jgi:hypothetical protein